MGEFKNRINVSINDQNFTIIGDDDPEHIRYVAHKSAGLDTTRKAILTAVNIMDEKVKLEEENEILKQMIYELKQQDS